MAQARIIRAGRRSVSVMLVSRREEAPAWRFTVARQGGYTCAVAVLGGRALFTYVSKPRSFWTWRRRIVARFYEWQCSRKGHDFDIANGYQAHYDNGADVPVTCGRCGLTEM
jgi:hypothetical protein